MHVKRVVVTVEAIRRGLGKVVQAFGRVVGNAGDWLFIKPEDVGSWVLDLPIKMRGFSSSLQDMDGIGLLA